MRYVSYATKGEPPFVDCNRTRTGWECLGPRGRVWAEKKSDALDEYLHRPGPFLFPGPIVLPSIPMFGGRPLIGRHDDIDIDIKNEYNIEAPRQQQETMPTVPTSGGRQVPPPTDPTPEPEVSGGFSMQGMPSWLLPAGALGLVLVLVLVMKK